MKKTVIVFISILTCTVFSMYAQSSLHLSSSVTISNQSISSVYVPMDYQSSYQQRGRIITTSVESDVKKAISSLSYGGFVSADEFIARTRTSAATGKDDSPAKRYATPRPTDPRGHSGYVPLTDAPWLLLFLAASYALFLRKRRKSLA